MRPCTFTAQLRTLQNRLTNTVGYSHIVIRTIIVMFPVNWLLVQAVQISGSTRWNSWLRHWPTTRKVAGLIRNGFIGIFDWYNPSGRTVAPGVDSASNRNVYQEHLLGCKGGRCVRLTALTLSSADLIEILGDSDSRRPKGLSRAEQGLVCTDIASYIVGMVKFRRLGHAKLCKARYDWRILVRNPLGRPDDDTAGQNYDATCQWRTQEFCSGRGVSTISVEDREKGVWGR